MLVVTQRDVATPPAIMKVVHFFLQVFSTLEGLPLLRVFNQDITLKRVVPNNVQSYYSPQVQKNEVERLVGEMLAMEIIRPSPRRVSNHA